MQSFNLYYNMALLAGEGHAKITNPYKISLKDIKNYQRNIITKTPFTIFNFPSIGYTN